MGGLVVRKVKKGQVAESIGSWADLVCRAGGSHTGSHRRSEVLS